MVRLSLNVLIGANDAASALTYLNFDDITILLCLHIGYALDPSVDTHQTSSSGYIGAVDEAEKNKGNHLQ